MELKSKKIEVAGNPFFVFLSNYAVNQFEVETGLKITDAATSTQTQLKLFYLCAKAGSLEAGVDFLFTWEQFLNLPYLETIEKFSKTIYGTEEDARKDPKKK